MPQIESTADMTGLYSQNLELMRKFHPRVAALLEQTVADPRLTVAYARSGHPVPLVADRAFHSLEDPLIEGQGDFRAACEEMGELVQQRLIFFGFGFGYHIAPFVAEGLSPIIHEPLPALLNLAMEHVDLSHLIPYVAFHFGAALPDIPRATSVITHPVAAELFPDLADAMDGKIMTAMPGHTNDIIEGIYYSAYRNVTCLKNPCDLAVYQMIIWEVRPTIILEIGACRGGSALYFGDLLRAMGGERHVYTFDITDEVAPETFDHPNVTFFTGGWQVFDPSIIKPTDRVLIIEDSSHTYENTLQVLRHFAPYVTPNSYLIVEDTRAGENRPHLNGGPLPAVHEFLAENQAFAVDARWENFYGSGNSGCFNGFLRRKAGC